MSHDLNPYQQMVREVGADLAIEVSLLVSAADMPMPERVYVHSSGLGLHLTLVTAGEETHIQYVIAGALDTGVGVILRSTEAYIKWLISEKSRQPEAG